MVDVDVPAHPSVDELREAICARGENLTCPVCVAGRSSRWRRLRSSARENRRGTAPAA
jgi:hypothetical protein